MNVIRQPAVAGSFYPGAARALGDAVASLLAVEPGYEGPPPKALIVPHAGYIYSGPTAAAGYARLRPFRERYRRVVLLGPCHRVPVRGLAASGAAAFRTPLGDVPVDIGALAALGLPTVEAAHRDEHSLEVHLPFLQTVLASFTLVPLVVGDASDAEVADVLEQLWDGPETLPRLCRRLRARRAHLRRDQGVRGGPHRPWRCLWRHPGPRPALRGPPPRIAGDDRRSQELRRYGGRPPTSGRLRRVVIYGAGWSRT
jgi:hypothetical protein